MASTAGTANIEHPPGATGGLPTSAGTLHAINVTEATDANRSIALADKPPVAPYAASTNSCNCSIRFTPATTDVTPG